MSAFSTTHGETPGSSAIVALVAKGLRITKCPITSLCVEYNKFDNKFSKGKSFRSKTKKYPKKIVNFCRRFRPPKERPQGLVPLLFL